jgi:hypothetical protein
MRKKVSAQIKVRRAIATNLLGFADDLVGHLGFAFREVIAAIDRNSACGETV